MRFIYRPLRTGKGIAKIEEYHGKPIHMDNLEDAMDSFNVDGFLGVFMFPEEMNKIKLNKKYDMNGFIILYDMHFRAVVIDFKNYRLMYYDPFGKQPEKLIDNFLKKLIKGIKSTYKYKYKINTIVNQRANSKNCGLHAIRFLLDIMVKRKSFIDATKYNIKEAERLAREKGAQLHSFGYI